MAELLGGRRDLCNAVEFGPFHEEVIQDDRCRLPQSLALDRRPVTDVWDICQLRLKDVRGAWTPLHFIEADLGTSPAADCRVRFGAVFRIEAERDAVLADAPLSTGWQALCEKLPVVVALFDQTYELVYANQWGTPFLAADHTAPRWRNCVTGSPWVRLPDIVHGLVTEAAATQCVVSRCIEHVEAGALVALHVIPVAIQAPSVESLLMVGYGFREPLPHLIASARTSARSMRIWPTGATAVASRGATVSHPHAVGAAEFMQDVNREFAHSETRLRQAANRDAKQRRDRSELHDAALPDSPVGSDDYSVGYVLFADDEQQVLAVGRRMLEHMGCRVLLASSGRKAVDMFARYAKEVDLVILDMTMPELTGQEALVEMRNLRPDVSGILTSGFNEYDILERLEQTNIDGFLHKPFRMQDFAQLVKSVLGRRRESGIAYPPAGALSADSRARGDR